MKDEKNPAQELKEKLFAQPKHAALRMSDSLTDSVSIRSRSHIISCGVEGSRFNASNVFIYSISIPPRVGSSKGASMGRKSSRAMCP